jgi:hypothetical protein
MFDDLDSFLDDLFLGCAFAAYAELATEQGRAPDSEAVKRRACRYYEEALAKKNAAKPPAP